ncbi:MAG: thiolase family protein [Chloroflexota bacterium]
MSEAYIISTVRTPVGRGKSDGALSSITPINLTALVLQEVVRRAGIEPHQIEDVVWGCVTPLGEQGANLARLGLLKAGYPVEVPAVTLNRMCGSGQQAIHFAVQAIMAGDMDLVVAGGTEMMSRVQMGTDWPASWPGDFPYPLVHQGISAEMMAEKWELTREKLDDYSYQSHIRAAKAILHGHFEGQILPITLPDGRTVTTDEGVRQSPDRQKMAAIKPAFREDGVITAGNASQISDGAGATLLASSGAVKRYNLKPMARVVARAVVGTDPVLMLDGPIPATHQVLKRSGLRLEQMDVVEVNEAFASVVLAWSREHKPDMDKVNPNGGAIALGHPLGATGVILMTKLVYELQRIQGSYGLQTMCIGHGMATATIIERV